MDEVELFQQWENASPKRVDEPPISQLVDINGRAFASRVLIKAEGLSTYKLQICYKPESVRKHPPTLKPCRTELGKSQVLDVDLTIET